VRFVCFANSAAHARLTRSARLKNLAPSHRCLKQLGSVLCGARAYRDLAVQPTAHEMRDRIGLPDILSPDGIVGEHANPVPQQPKLDTVDTSPTDAQPISVDVVFVFVTWSNGPILTRLRVVTLAGCITNETWWQVRHITKQRLGNSSVRILTATKPMFSGIMIRISHNKTRNDHPQELTSSLLWSCCTPRFQALDTPQ
jgi:hypothetical protein